MGLFDKKKKPKADFSNVQSGSSTTDPVRAATPRRYTVREGDTLSAIAKREYGDASEWRAIFEANRDRIEDPDRIYPGQDLDLPPNVQRGEGR